MDGRTACRCVTGRARAVSTGARVWEGMASQQHPAQVHHLATATAATAAMAADDTMSALVLRRNAHLAEGAVHERLGARPRFFAWLVRVVARLTIAADDIFSFQRLRLLGLFVTSIPFNSSRSPQKGRERAPGCTSGTGDARAN